MAKIWNPFFCENFQNSSPPTKTGTEGPPMKTSGIDQISAKFLKDGAPVIAIQLQLWPQNYETFQDFSVVRFTTSKMVYDI